jgi:hypothetical protein
VEECPRSLAGHPAKHLAGMPAEGERVVREGRLGRPRTIGRPVCQIGMQVEDTGPPAAMARVAPTSVPSVKLAADVSATGPYPAWANPWVSVMLVTRPQHGAGVSRSER